MRTMGHVIFDAFNTLVTSGRGSMRTFLAGLVQTCGARLLDLAWLVESSGVRSSLSDLLGRLHTCALSPQLHDGAGAP